MPLAWSAFLNQVGVVAAVAEQPLRLGQVVQQRCCTGVVADLAGGHEEAQRTTRLVGERVELGVQPSSGAADQAANAPFSSRRLAAVRCAFR